jgi:archaellum biogenesis ATPase FlaH
MADPEYSEFCYANAGNFILFDKNLNAQTIQIAGEELFLNYFFNKNKNYFLSKSGARHTGKSTFVQELIAQYLMTGTGDNEVLFIDSLSHFEISSFTQILATYFKQDTTDLELRNVLRRFKHIEACFPHELREIVFNLEALLISMPKTSLVVIDSLHFFYYEKFFNDKSRKYLSKAEYINNFTNRLSRISKQYKCTIIYVLPDHLSFARSDSALGIIKQENGLDISDELNNFGKRGIKRGNLSLLMPIKPDIEIRMYHANDRNNKKLYAMDVTMSAENISTNPPLLYTVDQNGIHFQRV